MFGKMNWIVVAVMAVLLSACQSPPKDNDDKDAWGTGYSKQELKDRFGIDRNPIEYTTVYFEYDSSTISERANIIISAHARNLSTKSGTNVVLEGHADERGTREYNLALGERRSTTVQNLMQTVGAGSNSLSAVSYGEERPVALAHDEASWQANRRVQILY